jgi:hypothetical protein
VPISEEQLAAVDRFLANENKVLDGFQPHWTHAKGYRDFQLPWPIYEEDRGTIRAQLRFRVPDQDFSFPSISLIFQGQMVSRIDRADTNRCKPNPPWAARVGLPAEVCGTHMHCWDDNRGFVAASGLWELHARRPVQQEPHGLDAMFLWFCERINVRIQPDNRPIKLPDGGLFGGRNA